MRPRMYGSRLRKWWRTSTWPSTRAGVSVVTSLKLSTVASPWGRLSSRICWLAGMLCLRWFEGNRRSVGLDGVQGLRGLAHRQARHELEGAGGVGAELAAGVEDAAFGEGHGGGAVQQLAFGEQRPLGSAHEAGLHLDGDATHGRLHRTRGVRHDHVEQRHAGAAMHHVEGVFMLGPGRESDLRLAAFERLQFEAEQFDKRNVNRELQSTSCDEDR